MVNVHCAIREKRLSHVNKKLFADASRRRLSSPIRFPQVQPSDIEKEKQTDKHTNSQTERNDRRSREIEDEGKKKQTSCSTHDTDDPSVGSFSCLGDLRIDFSIT